MASGWLRAKVPTYRIAARVDGRLANRSRPLSRASAIRAHVADYCALTKPGITFFVVLTVAAGFILASAPGASAARLVHTLVGTALATGGAAALNHLLERATDARMQRTRNRPLPAGRLSVRSALVFAATIAILGLAELYLWVGPRPTFLVALCLVSYAFVYTPLKRRSHLSTLIGAVPGALPVVAGWTAAGAPADARAWTFFAILYLWQIPHFLALAWLYREDYGRAGLCILTVRDKDGLAAGSQALSYAAVLLPVSLLPTMQEVTGSFYFWGAFILGALYLAAAAAMALTPVARTARNLFLASILYLPALYGLIALDRTLG